MNLQAMLPAAGVVLLAAGACGDVGVERRAPPAADQVRAMVASTPPAIEEGLASEAPGRLASLVEMQASLKLIRTATLTVEVEAFDSAATAVARFAQASGGYVADSRRSRNERGASQGFVTVRVPTDRFVETLTALQGLGEVRDEAQSTQDVTKAYADLEIRVAIKREAAQRLREILGNRTGKLSDVLEVERELARVVEEIERLEGERRFYDQQVALSTITVTLYEPGAERGDGALAPITSALGESAPAFATSIGVLIYGAAYLLPWIALALAGWFGTTRVRAALVRRKESD